MSLFSKKTADIIYNDQYFVFRNKIFKRTKLKGQITEGAILIEEDLIPINYKKILESDN